MSDVDAVIGHIRANKEKALEELKELLRIPSVSAQDEHAGDMKRAADWVAASLRDAGLENVELLPTGKPDAPGHPVVYADWLHAEGAPTVLVYGHYDVQPGEPFELWETPPFEPTVRDGKLYARGATDDKGQMFTHVKAVAAHLAVNGDLPVNVKFVIEGEEEVGSENLEAFVAKEKKRLAADVVLISDTAMWDEKHPSIVYSLRGLTYFYVDAKGAKSDLHSGTFGGAAPNAAEWLAKLLAAAKDPKTGKVKIPGFYDDVKVSRREREALAKLPFNENRFKRANGLPGVFTEKGWSALEGTSIRPTFEVNGMWGGYTGKGQKTVLPNEAHAKISMRLVGDQDPRKIARAFKKWVKEFEKTTPGIKFSVEAPSLNPPAKVPLDHPAMQAGVTALKGAFPDAKDVFFVAEGGSIPVVGMLQDTLKAPSVLMGFGLHDENLHAPNEHIRVKNFERGMEASARFLFEVARAR